jgi:hypothetical protein
MVGGVLTRVLPLCVGLGVGGAAVASGSRGRPSHSCDGWVCDLGAVGVSLIFGLIRGTGSLVGDSLIFGLIRGVGDFVAVLPTFVLVSRMKLAQQYRVNGHFLNSAEVFTFPCRLGCRWGGRHLWVARSTIVFA